MATAADIHTDVSSVRRPIRILFPVLLWLAATFFLLGGTGFWSDDYFHNLRGPDNAIPAIRFFGHFPFWSLGMDRGFFIRPLFYEIVPAITTLAWDYPWMPHLIQALCHAAAVLILWRLMISLGLRRASAAAASLLFMVFPPHFEAILWTSALPTTIATAIMLGVLHQQVRFARSSRGWWRIALMAAMTLAVCCLNEQPVIVVFAMPLLYAAALPRGTHLFTTRHIARALAPSLACGVIVLMYVGLLTGSAPAGARGSTQTFITASEAPHRFIEFVDILWRRLIMKNFAHGAWSLGIDAIRTANTWGVSLFAALLLSAIAWVFRAESPRTAPTPPTAARPLYAAAFGFALFLTGWLPILIFSSYDPDSRTRYWPMLGIAIAVASLCSLRDGVEGKAPFPSNMKSRLLRAVLAATLLASTILLIGTQSAFRIRWQRDQSEAAQLRQLIPNPQPLSFFLPINLATTGIHTGSPVLDGHFRSQWEFPWTMPRQIQRIYAREDVRAGYWRRQLPLNPTLTADARGILCRDRLGPAFPPDDSGGSWIPWDKLIPFIVDESGTVRIVTRITAAGQEYQVPQSRGQPDLPFTLPRR